MAQEKSQFAEPGEEAPSAPGSPQAVQARQARESHRVQTDCGLRRKTSSVYCSGEAGKCQERNDAPLRGEVAVVFLSTIPVHPLQSRFAWRNGHRSRPG